jgi:hypothetical protein
MRRIVLSLGVLIAMIMGSGAIAVAQSSPAASGSLLAGLGFPEVVITFTDAGFEVPADIQAGATLLTLDNQGSMPAGFSLIQLPEGVSMADLMPPAAEAGASPAAEGEEGGGGLPPALYDATWAGGAFAMPGSTGSVVVNLGPGEWILDTGPESGLPPTTFTVAGEASDTPITADGAVEVELDDFQIVLPESIPAGPSIWQVSNVGEQPHEVYLATSPGRIAPEDVMTLATLPEDATPPPGLPGLDQFVDVGFVAPISAGQTVLIEMNLPAGDYVGLCFMPTKDDPNGLPHVMNGMAVSFSTAEEGQTVEPPASPAPSDHSH